ncbi:molybdate ABC transporter substrate-binding protein [Thermosulfurimonas marina]|uniref:Molybdate ABC transporter substrate-binding protein n=1 Tax=Thermosulfurimonas marina TaxID=2047767 RepID=A0A6H1WQG6_9BACT|nr:molybdate ABC transporter substrate-binding protein [Thermosulfurimonas marina]QJA05442.1 molybdate ABC transporter substrate-binding protein [Thermosulfurimonas marina]
MVKKVLLFWALLGLWVAVAGAEKRLLIFAGSASKPATEEAARVFERRTGTKVDLVFGGSGFVLSQMLLSHKGDLYFPGSSDYMELAKEKGAVLSETERRVVYLVPAIIVARGNPKHIRGLRDLLRPEVRVAIANPEGVCLGAYAVEVLEKSLSPEEVRLFRKKLVNYTGSCAKTAAVVALGAVDAVLGWRVFALWDPEHLEVVKLKPQEVARVGYIPIAVSRFSQNRKLAEDFIRFLLSEEGRAIFRRHGYFMSPEEAFAWLGEKKPVGGRFEVPRSWLEGAHEP